MSQVPTSKPFNFHAWATRNSDGAGRKYTLKEHLTYVCIALALLIGSMAIGVWLMAHGAQAAHEMWVRAFG